MSIRAAASLLLAAAWFSSFVKAGEPHVVVGDDPRRPTFTADLPADVALKLSEQPAESAAQALLRVALLDPQGQTAPPLFGGYSRVERQLRFQPAFQLTPGATYRAVLTLPGDALQQLDYRVPTVKPGQVTTVEHIYPSGDRLPANLLKFYLYFSQPMRDTAAVFDHLHLEDSQGERVFDPWRRQSMWSDDGCRLTLLIHPGRIKKGVNLREEFGPVLRPNERYTLVIDPDVLDAAGQPLGKRYEKRFIAISEDNVRPSIPTWRLNAPRVGTREPLIVAFDEILEHALVRRLLHVIGPDDTLVTGEVELREQERAWALLPLQPWRAGLHTLHADELLEDLAGNTPNRVFDTDLDQAELPSARLTQSFRPAP